MTASRLRFLAALFALTLIIGGCTIGRSRTSALSPRDQPSASSMTADLETLRRENAQLRDQQEALQNRLEAMQSTLAQNQEEQRRYRESMTRNFDLLEQSVALTLSKTITADLGRQPAAGTPVPATVTNPAPRPMAAAPQSAPAAAPRSAAMSQAAAAPAPAMSASSQPARAPVPMAGGKPAMDKMALTPVALGPAQSAPQPAVEDADLLPPQSPRTLAAHQEAKPLYEKGFSLFARKDYDQAVIVFQNFLNRFPDDIYSDNAQFWIAEAYAGLNRSKEAEDAYRAVLRNYEHRSTLEGYKTPDAIYRLGQLYQHRGEARRARAFYDALVERFPETSAGRKAQRELSTLGINTAAR
jgi:tol-pal system protein YbgF